MIGKNVRQVARGFVLSSLAMLMVAGFLLMGGLGSGDSAEAFRCERRWFSRCNSIPTLTTSSSTTTTTTTTTSDVTVTPCNVEIAC